MRLRYTCFFVPLLLASLATAASASPRIRRGPTVQRLSHSRSARGTAKPASHLGIAPERATEIQQALIKAGYMNGTPSGVWDSDTQNAMQKLQADHGWQTKIVPDSRAIITLGLGPASTSSSVAESAAEPSTVVPSTIQ